jgi:hypothetical protein
VRAFYVRIESEITPDQHQTLRSAAFIWRGHVERSGTGDQLVPDHGGLYECEADSAADARKRAVDALGEDPGDDLVVKLVDAPAGDAE